MNHVESYVMNLIKTVARTALLIGYIWAADLLYSSLKNAQAFCSSRLDYLFLDNFMFVAFSVLPIVIFAFVIYFIFRPLIKRIDDEYIVAVFIAISLLPVAFFRFAPDKFVGVSGYMPAVFKSIVSAFGVGIIVSLLYRHLIKRTSDLLLAPVVAAVVIAMPFIMKSANELYWIRTIGLSPTRLASFGLYLLPFVGLFLLFLVWFRLKPRAAVILGWIFLIVSVIFTVILPKLYTGPNISCKESSKSDKPNFLLIVIDALRADAIEPYGGPVSTSNLSKFALDSAVFEKAYTVAPWTLPSIASFFTGLYPSAHGANRFQTVLNGKFEMVSQLLKRNGYYSWAVLDQPLYMSFLGVDRGFDVFHLISCRPNQLISSHPLVGKTALINVVYKFLGFRETEQVARDAAAAIERSCKPFFGWVHILDPHMPLTPPVEFMEDAGQGVQSSFGAKVRKKPVEIYSLRVDVARGDLFIDRETARRIKDAYFGEVRYVDHEIKYIFSALKESGIWNKTVVLVTADHGEEFLDHGGFEHGHSVYNEILHVPFIMHVPNAKPTRIQTRVRTIDFAPTVLELAGVKFEPNSFQGQSLVALINGVPEEDREVLAESMVQYEEKKALVMGPYKLIWRPLTKEYRLFNIVEDPRELFPIKGEDAIKIQMYKRLRRLLADSANIYRQTTGQLPYRVYEPPPADTVEQLKSLGYTD